MTLIRYITIATGLFIIICQMSLPALGQMGVALDVKKPKEFENRVLRSEKSDQKKFTLPKRFIQNTITHYNYFFNANNKLNEVIQRAKTAFTDDYSLLIPFYNYTLEATAADSLELDSISSKAQTGIVLHDLRSDWADNLYLLWGASYYLKQQFDSAQLMFQFINYAFAEKEKDGYYRMIGSARDGNSALSISTKEKNSLPRRVFAEPPSRNDAFIWQIRNHLARDQFAEASSLIQALKNDPLFPGRLNNDLEEVQAYLFYKQEMWDSCAAHLGKALSNATGKGEKARWEYLLAQLYETTHKNTEAEKWYSQSISHTTDPIMDIYARLAMVRVNKDSSENYIEKNIATLLKMAKRDKYQDYRDIIYYMAAQIELERNNIDGALPLLLKSTKYTANNPNQRNKAFLQLAELSFIKRQYRQSYNFYDSLQLDNPGIKDPEAIIARKEILSKLAGNVEIIERQDSLQRLAAMPEDERKSFIKKMVRQLRKQQGLKDEGVATAAKTFPSKQEPPAPSLFADNSKKGEWYFYNKNSRQNGLKDFEAKWGKRINVDDWRRSTSISAGKRPSAVDGQSKAQNVTDPAEAAEDAEITFDALNEKIPLTTEKLQQSNDSVQTAQFDLGILYIQQLEDCKAATETLEDLRKRFPQHPKMEEVLFNLYYCYNKHGETARAGEIKNLMSRQYADSKLTAIVTTGKGTDAAIKEQETAATKTYEKVYDLFVEGKFSEAIAGKKIADSIYGSSHWEPQLLYIEAVYYIKQREDSAATVVLINLINKSAGTPLSVKATTLLEVLSRRKEIEEELNNMVINLPPADSSNQQKEIITTGKPVTLPSTRKDTVNLKNTKPPVVVNKAAIDSISRQPIKQISTDATFQFENETPHYVVIVLTKVDPIFVNEAKNAFARYNKDTYYNKQMQAELIEIDTANRLLLISPFKNTTEALAYIEQTRPKTSSEIIPWLKGGKYSYSIITDKNLEILKNSKDLDKYKKFLDKNVPGKF
ncbi:MAG: type IX secretion system periplasmic lipoprotein PorW/SprE [Chitinophagaceae bacterium]